MQLLIYSGYLHCELDKMEEELNAHWIRSSGIPQVSVVLDEIFYILEYHGYSYEKCGIKISEKDMWSI